MVELAAHVGGEVDRRGTVARTAPDPVGTLHVGEANGIGPQEAPRPPRVAETVDEGAGTDLRWQGEAPPDVALTPSQYRRVHGQAERLEVGCSRPLHHCSDEVPVPPGVHLEPEAGAGRGHRGALLDRPGSHGRQRERDSGPTCGADHGQLACRIGYPRETGRGQHQGKGQRATQQGRRRVQFTQPHQDPGSKAHRSEGSRVALQRRLVLGTTVDVVKDPGRQATTRHAAEVIHVRRRPEPPH